MFINQHSINFKNCRKPWYLSSIDCRKPWYLSSIETTVKDDAQRACFACSCYYYLLYRNPILFLTNPLNSTGCGFCQYFRGNHQTTHNYTVSLKGVYWPRFLSVEHNQTKNRRIGGQTATTIQSNSQLKCQTRKLYSWTQKCTKARE